MFGGAVICCPNEKYCRECAKDGQGKEFCRQCEGGYFDVKEGKCVQKSVQEAAVCSRLQKVDEKIVCLECKIGYTLDLDGRCLPCQKQSCAVCSLNQECSACQNSQLFIRDECSAEKKCPEENCSICTSFGRNDCLVCNPGFALNVQKKCVNSKNNCESVNEENVCVRCKEGFYIGYGDNCIANKSSVWLTVTVWIVVVALAIGILYVFWKDFANKYQYAPNQEGYQTA